MIAAAGNEYTGQHAAQDRERVFARHGMARGLWQRWMSKKDGGPCRTRTYNQLIKSQLLYQLS